MTKHGIGCHRPLKLYRAERLLVDMAFKQEVVGLDKQLISKALRTVMQLGAFKSLPLLGIGSQLEINAQQLLEHQIEDIHHASGDLGDKYQHFHTTKIE